MSFIDYAHCVCPFVYDIISDVGKLEDSVDITDHRLWGRYRLIGQLLLPQDHIEDSKYKAEAETDPC